MVNLHWFRALYEGRESFESTEEEKAYRESQYCITKEEVQKIWRLLGMKPGQTVLEIFSGNGRHAVILAERGVRVVGVDIAFSRVRFATRWAKDDGVPARFIVGDASFLPLRATFDGALILGGSFSHLGYWNSDVRFLKFVKSRLSPGGFLFIDNPNPIRFLRVKDPTVNAMRAEELPWFDFPLAGPSGGYIRYWGAGHMFRMLQEAGYKEVKILGDRDGGAYTSNSPRLLALGIN